MQALETDLLAPEKTEEISPRRVCFVCTGNTCRSPMAQAVTNQLAREALDALPKEWRHLARPSVEAFSAGLYAKEGDPISPPAAEALQAVGIPATPENDYLRHRAHTITPEEAEGYDLLVGLTKGHAMELLLRLPQFASRIRVLPKDIPDPYGGDIEVYKHCLSAITEGIRALLFPSREEPATPLPRIVPLESCHLEQAAQLESLCFSRPWSADALRLLTGEMGYGAAAVDENGMLLGYGGMLIAPDEGQITNIAVHPDHRRRGIGKALLEALTEECKRRKLGQMSLEVRASNQAAIELYLKQDFRVMGRRKGFYRHPPEDALVMIKEL